VASGIRTLVVLDAGLSHDQVLSALPEDANVDIVSVVEGMDAAGRALESTDCDVLVIACEGYSDRVLFLIESAVNQDSERPVIVLSQGSSNGFVHRVFEAGAEDILMLPQSSQTVSFTIQKSLARRGGARVRGSNPGRLIVVLGPKGGTGKTLTSTNLAVAMQNEGERVAIVDLDLQFGDIALCMGLPPGKTIYDMAASGPVDASTLDAHLATHASGVRALLAPNRPDQASGVSVEAVREVYALLREQFDAVIVDTPPGFTPEVIASIDLSTDLVMVGMLDTLSLKNTKLGLETLELMGYNPEHIRLVLNRAHSRVGISTADVGSVLGRPPDVLVPSDREIPRSVNEGVPIVTTQPQSVAAVAFRQLAAFYTGVEVRELVAAAPAARGRRVFRRRK
jgi:pilus assembly protein CpaE